LSSFNLFKTENKSCDQREFVDETEKKKLFFSNDERTWTVLIMDGKGAADAMAKKGSAEEAAHFKKIEAEQLAKIKAQKEAAEKK